MKCFAKKAKDKLKGIFKAKTIYVSILHSNSKNPFKRLSDQDSNLSHIIALIFLGGGSQSTLINCSFTKKKLRHFGKGNFYFFTNSTCGIINFRYFSQIIINSKIRIFLN